MHPEGGRLTLQPTPARTLLALLARLSAIEETFPEIDDPTARPIGRPA